MQPTGVKCTDVALEANALLTWRFCQTKELEKLFSNGAGGRVVNSTTTILSICPKRSAGKSTILQDCSSYKNIANRPITAPGKEGEHIIVPFKDFVMFVEDFACRRCRVRVKGLTQQQYGIATEITYTCDCGWQSNLLPETVAPMEGEDNGGQWENCGSSYALNVRLMLATHMFGASQEAGTVIASFLLLSSSVFKKAWYKMEDRFGILMRKDTDDILLENKANEVDGIAPENGYKPVDVSGDGGWQTRGRAFNSILGHSILIGKRTNKVLACRVYAKHCVKCKIAEKIGQIPKQHQCLRNYVGSSKGMESTGLLECILDLHNNSGLYVRKFVIDYDTTTKAYARHSYKLLVEEGLMLKDDWPRSDTGLSCKTDYGKLPLSHPQICFIADPNHRVRTYGGALWGLNACSKSETEMTPVDCHWLKRNFAYWLHSGATLSRREFKLRVPLIVLHHFNDHSSCNGSWCIYVSKGKKFAENTGKYRCMKENKKLFGQLDSMLKKYTTKTRLDKMHHSFSSQKNEALNKVITWYAPKSACYSKTKSLNTRIAIAIGVNSVVHYATGQA